MKAKPTYFRPVCRSPAGLTQLGGVTAPLQLLPPLSACCLPAARFSLLLLLPALISNAAATMTGIAAASFFSNACRFGGCGLHFDSLAELIVHIEDNHIGKRPGNERRS